eukprot:scaffold1138_cov128-Cylindrotheca_fusiformis.AAC.25
METKTWGIPSPVSKCCRAFKHGSIASRRKILWRINIHPLAHQATWDYLAAGATGFSFQSGSDPKNPRTEYGDSDITFA